MTGGGLFGIAYFGQYGPDTEATTTIEPGTRIRLIGEHDDEEIALFARADGLPAMVASKGGRTISLKASKELN